MEMTITKNSGEIVTRQHLRNRTSSALSTWRGHISIDDRRAAIASTIDCDEWLRGKSHQTVASVIRAVEHELL